MNKCFSKLILVTLALLPGTSLCADIKTIEVNKENNLYHMHINATVHADLDNVIRIITDYENLPLINPYLKESKLLDNPEDERTTVNMLTEICVLFLCYNIRHIQIYPVTRIILDIEMVPDFFVPPVIGPYQIKKIMLEMTRDTILNLEKKAKTNPPG